MKLLKLLILLFISIGLTSCVTTKKFRDMETKYYDAFDDIQKLKIDLEILNTQNESLIKDTTDLGAKLQEKIDDYENLSKSYQILSLTKKKEIEGKTSEIVELQNQLLDKEEELKKRESSLEALAKELGLLESDLKTLQTELLKKEASLKELEGILAKQKLAVESLKKKVSEALLVFENKGLTVNVKNGKVYVSLDEALLFASGSTKVDTKGEEALKNLAKVLETNTDISVLIEGHTDNVPYVSSSGCIKDNWDLSVMRATSIVRILLKHGKIEPSRLIPAGRGEFLPIDATDTKEARAKNRRIEIILTPKLDELFQIIENN